MLKTNSEKAIENVRAYICEDSEYLNECAEYDGVTLTTAADFAAYAYRLFTEQKRGDKRRLSTYALFEEWASGLALGGMFDYYYRPTAKRILGDILEESEAERDKYTEAQAESLLTLLIFREMQKAYDKKNNI